MTATWRISDRYLLRVACNGLKAADYKYVIQFRQPFTPQTPNIHAKIQSG